MNKQSTKFASLSFIIPAMNGEKHLEALYQEIRENVNGARHSWEVIFIDDGSNDNTWEEMKKLAMHHSLHMKAYRFQENEGAADALALGYEKANGEVIFAMDADLQDAPKQISRFLAKLDEGYDVVSAEESQNQTLWQKVVSNRVLNTIISKITGVKLQDHHCGFKAYRQEVIKSLPMNGDSRRLVPSHLSSRGFETAEIELKHQTSKFAWGRIFAH